MSQEQQREDASVDLLSPQVESERIPAAVRIVACRTFTPLSRDPTQKPDALTKDIVRYVLKNYPREISLDDLAREVGRSRFYLVRRFRGMTGMTPGAFLKRVRLVKAMNLLVESRLEIKHIAREVGYADPSAFSRAFRATAGTSPRLYRSTRRWPAPADETAGKNAGAKLDPRR
jgi:AraC-like DNA-binding protein